MFPDGCKSSGIMENTLKPSPLEIAHWKDPILSSGGFISYSKEAAVLEVVLLGGAGPEFVQAQFQHFHVHEYVSSS